MYWWPKVFVTDPSCGLWLAGLSGDWMAALVGESFRDRSLVWAECVLVR